MISPHAAAGLLALAAGLAISSATAAPPDALVYILAGQSNLAGRAPASQLPAAGRTPPPHVHLDYVCSFGAAYGPGAEPAHQSAAWVDVAPQPPHHSTPEAHFGPEIGFACALAEEWPGREIYLIKHGRGATSLAVDWDPDAGSGRRHYAELLGQVRAALARLKAEGRAYRLAGFVWAQGEADAMRPDQSQTYEANFTRFLTRLRRDLGAPQLPVVVLRTGDRDPRLACAAAVRAAQQHVVDRLPPAALLSTDAVHYIDSVHYDGAGQWALGREAARIFLTQFPP